MDNRPILNLPLVIQQGRFHSLLHLPSNPSRLQTNDAGDLLLLQHRQESEVILRPIVAHALGLKPERPVIRFVRGRRLLQSRFFLPSRIFFENHLGPLRHRLVTKRMPRLHFLIVCELLHPLLCMIAYRESSKGVC